ncbi:MAG: hypothetical protein CMM44_05540 [Rhodospirillaceae bacterium]|nr:hypothetical protein [Rhodospirillaceae bacterium]|tara:strand:- start:3620 stop:4441 length:822 start_codon:yes stop_codon:yes gene_type:complete
MSVKFLDPHRIVDVMRNCANDIVMPYFRNLSDTQIWRKKNNSIVTIADIKSEEFLQRNLLNLLPGSTTIGEEETENDPRIVNRLRGDKPVWVIDPVDGTSNYAQGKKRFSMIIALCINGEAIGGWLATPATDRYFWSMKDEGSWSGEKRIFITGNKIYRSQKLSGSLGAKITKLEGIRNNFKNLYRQACCGADYMDIAEEKLDFAFYRGGMKVWDHCAGDLLVREAGGHTGELVTGKAYRPINPPYNGILASCSKKVFNSVSEILKNSLEKEH